MLSPERAEAIRQIIARATLSGRSAEERLLALENLDPESLGLRGKDEYLKAGDQLQVERLEISLILRQQITP